MSGKPSEGDALSLREALGKIAEALAGTDDGLIFRPPLAALRARAYHALVGLGWGGPAGARHYWKKFGPGERLRREFAARERAAYEEGARNAALIAEGFLAEARRERDALRLLEGMEALEVSVLGAFLKGGDIPATVDAARGAVVRRMLEAERDAMLWSAHEESARQVLQRARAAMGCPFDGTNVVEFAGRLAAVEAPARELLFLYDWRFELAADEACPLRTAGQVRETERKLREYGERKKAGWAALRAALAALGPAGRDDSAGTPCWGNEG